MIGNTITSFFDNLATKSKNPFLGTFVIVWLSRNWELVFALFNFDESYRLQDKIDFLAERVKYESFWSEFGWNVFWTFLILTMTYALINAARVITNLFEMHLTPWVYKLTADSQSIVLRKDHDALKLGIIELEKRVEQERDEKLKARTEINNLEERIKILLEESTIDKTKISELQEVQSDLKNATFELKEIESSGELRN